MTDKMRKTVWKNQFKDIDETGFGTRLPLPSQQENIRDYYYLIGKCVESREYATAGMILSVTRNPLDVITFLVATDSGLARFTKKALDKEFKEIV